MKMNANHKIVVLCSIGLMTIFAANAESGTPLFDYQFPASFDGTSQACVDLSAAGNDATIYNTAGYAADVRPDGFTSGGSLYGADGGYGFTDNINLLNNAAVEAGGGYYFDVWVKPAAWAAGEIYAAQIIDYAGTEDLRLIRTETAGNYTYYFQFRGNNDYNLIDSDPITLGQWYHVRWSYDSLDGRLSINQGVGVLAVDDLTTEKRYSALFGKAPYGDTLNRPIGLNNWSGNFTDPSNAIAVHQGYIYNPTVGIGPHSDLKIYPGDANCDGCVDEDDAGILAAYWQTATGAYWMQGDFNGDGAVNDIDATMLAANWQRSNTSASVPEPTMLTLLGIGLTGFIVLSRRAGRKQ